MENSTLKHVVKYDVSHIIDKEIRALKPFLKIKGYRQGKVPDKLIYHRNKEKFNKKAFRIFREEEFHKAIKRWENLNKDKIIIEKELINIENKKLDFIMHIKIKFANAIIITEKDIGDSLAEVKFSPEDLNGEEAYKEFVQNNYIMQNKLFTEVTDKDLILEKDKYSCDVTLTSVEDDKINDKLKNVLVASEGEINSNLQGKKVGDVVEIEYNKSTLLMTIDKVYLIEIPENLEAIAKRLEIPFLQYESMIKKDFEKYNEKRNDMVKYSAIIKYLIEEKLKLKKTPETVEIVEVSLFKLYGLKANVKGYLQATLKMKNIEESLEQKKYNADYWGIDKHIKLMMLQEIILGKLPQ